MSGQPNRDERKELEELIDRSKASFLKFLREFKASEGSQTTEEEYVYKVQARRLLETGHWTLYVDFSHIMSHDNRLADVISLYQYKLQPHLRAAAQEFVETEHGQSYSKDLKGRVWVSFYNFLVLSKLRELRVEKVGKLSAVMGTVTRTSEIRPELLLGTFSCDDCNTTCDAIEQQFKYTEPTLCKNPQCTNRSRWTLQVEKSIFIDWQRVRVQENTDEIPSGSMPRSLDVILRHEIVDKAKAGDKCIFTGSLIVVPDISQLRSPGERKTSVRQGPQPGAAAGFPSDGVTGLKALGVRDLTYRLAFLATGVQNAEHRTGIMSIRDDDDDVNVNDIFSTEELNEIELMKSQRDIYNRLANSIAPTVFGHEEIKRGVLLMLFGGIHKKTKEGIGLRGDINVCIVGDPSTAKSQFLKYVVSFLPRAVYTSGKSASAAGLTASVVKDPETGEFCIEAGALMLADNVRVIDVIDDVLL